MEKYSQIQALSLANPLARPHIPTPLPHAHTKVGQHGLESEANSPQVRQDHCWAVRDMVLNTEVQFSPNPARLMT